MNLQDFDSLSFDMRQDKWSITSPRFGEDGQLEVVGWADSGGKYKSKQYILKCSICSLDADLFGQGCFSSLKYHLVKGVIPCGCSTYPKWNKEQYEVLCKRKAESINCKFIGFVGQWKASKTKIEMLCPLHGTWFDGRIHHLLNSNIGCPGCGLVSIGELNSKTYLETVQSFIASGAFHPDTKFWKSSRVNREGQPLYWYMSCPECGEEGEASRGNLQQGQRPCACSKHRQQEAYINWMTDDSSPIAIKFGIANNSNRRTKQQNSKSMYGVVQHSVYTFRSVEACKAAERDCKQELECGIVLKRDMPDGYTETTWVYNLGKIVEIYERNGGILKQNA